MNKKRFLGFTFVLIGVLLSLSRVVLTGAVIGTPNASFLGLFGSLIFLSGLILIASSRSAVSQIEEKVQVPEEVRSIAQSFLRNRKPKKEVWVIRYHAYPRNAKPTFSRMLEAEKAASGGFYFTETPEDALQAAELRGYERKDLKLARVRISRNVYREKNRTSRDIIQYAGSGEFSDEYHPYEFIPSKKFRKANKLIEKGLIRIESVD